MNKFPVGGRREPVYNFMRDHGFVMSKWSDKIWERADGVQASIYGTGSMLRLVKDAQVIADAPIQEAMREAPFRSKA